MFLTDEGPQEKRKEKKKLAKVAFSSGLQSLLKQKRIHAKTRELSVEIKYYSFLVGRKSEEELPDYVKLHTLVYR